MWKNIASRLPKNITVMPTMTKLRRKLKSFLENTATPVSTRKSTAVRPKAAGTTLGAVRATIMIRIPANTPQMYVKIA